MQLNRTIIMTLAAAMPALGTLWLTNGAVTPKDATWADVLTEAKSRNWGFRLTANPLVWPGLRKSPSLPEPCTDGR